MDYWKSAGKVTFARSVNALIAFIGLLIFARLLNIGSLGIFFLFQAVVGVVEIVVDFGLNQATEKRISQGGHTSRIISSTIAFKVGMFLFVVVLLFTFRSQINSYIGVDITVYIMAAILLKNVANFFINVLNGQMRVSETASIIVLEQAGWLLFGLLFATLELGVFSLIYGSLITYVLMIVLGFWKVSFAIVLPSKEVLISLLDYGKFDLVSEAGWRIYSWTDVLIIGFFLTANHVGAYEVAWRITSVTIIFGRGIRTSLFPVISAWETDGELEKIEAVLRRSLPLTLLFVVPSFIGVLLLSSDILGILFGAEYVIASVAFIILMGQKVLQGIDQVIGYTLRGMDRPDLAAVSTTVAIIANIVFNITFIPRFGLSGGAVATFLSYLILISIQWKFLSGFVDIPVPGRPISWMVFSALIMGLFVWTIQETLNVDSFGTLAICIAIPGITYVALVLVNNPIRQGVASVLGMGSTTDQDHI